MISGQLSFNEIFILLGDKYYKKKKLAKSRLKVIPVSGWFPGRHMT